MSRKAPDRAAEELRLELEALNQALQCRCHTRCKSHRGASLRHPSPKHPLQPKPSFKVPFRSTSVISSCAHFPTGQASPSRTKPPHHPKQEKQAGPQCPSQQLEKKCTKPESKGHDHQLQQPERQIGFWRSWPRPLRAISRLIMSSHRRLHVLFSLHIHRIEGLPLPMNGLRLAVRWKCQDHGLQTMPSRIFHGTADFEETLAHRCTVYGTHTSNDMTRYDEKLSTVSIVALDVDDLELAKHHMDLASLLQNHDINPHPQQQITSYELSGMAKGSTLIVSLGHELAHGKTVRGKNAILVRNKQLKKTSGVSTKSLALSKQGCPLVDASALETSPPLTESGADSALHHPAMQKLLLDESHTPLQAASSADNTVLEGCVLSDHGCSSSFEFKPISLDFFAEDDHQEQFTFPRVEEEVRPASIKNFDLPLDEEEGLLQVKFSFNQTVRECGNSNMSEDEERKFSTQMQLEQGKPQGTYCGDSGREGPAIGEWANEESKFIKVLQTESDDEADLIAEEFLKFLGIK